VISYERQASVPAITSIEKRVPPAMVLYENDPHPVPVDQKQWKD